jgi:anti-sigma-K factor RskA
MTPEERDQLAAEYALGLLEGEELARARALAAADPDFSADVARWSGRLAPLLDEVEPVAPPPHVLGAIEQRIAAPQTERQAQPSNVVQLRRRLNVWRGFAVGASALAASLALVLVTRPEPVVQTPPAREAPAPMVAMMEAEDTDARLVATWDPADRSLVVAAAAGVQAVSTHSHELWVIPADGTPRSMGVMPAGRAMHVRVAGPMAGRLAEGSTLALSVEPAGGSPTGQPTGPVIAAGKLQRT